MNEPFTPCHYHPNKTAVTVCNRCRRPICLEDKHIFTVKSSNWHYLSAGIYGNRPIIKKYTLCTICNATMLNSKAKAAKDSMYFLPVMVIVCLFLLVYLWNKIILFVLIFSIFLIIGSIIISTVNTTEGDATKALTEVVNFKKNLYSSPNILPSLSSLDIFSLQCYECGSNLTLQDKFCQQCGNSTHEELMDFYKVVKGE